MAYTQAVLATFGTGLPNEGMQLLNDGNILLTNKTGSSVWAPDEFGSYKDGSIITGATTQKHLNPTDSHTGGVLILEDNGKVTRWGGHPQYDSAAADKVQVYNPKTHTWDESHASPDNHQDAGGISWVEHVGRVCRVGSEASYYSNGAITSSGLNSGTMLEAGPALLPNGDRITLLCDPGSAGLVPVLIHSAADGALSSVNLTRPTTNPRSWVWERSAIGHAHWMLMPFHDNNGGYREHGPSIYMPKIGKVVQVAGGDGTMWAYDHGTQTIEVMSATMPMPSGVFTSEGSLSSIHNGQTVAQLLSGTIRFTATAGLTLVGGQGENRWSIATSSGKCVGVEPTSMLKNGVSWSTGSCVNGDVIELVSPSAIYGPTTDTVVTGANVYKENIPIAAGAEQFCAILPDGSHATIVGANRHKALSSNASKFLAIFDGTNWVAEEVIVQSIPTWGATVPFIGSTTNDAPMVVCPSGELMIGGVDRAAFRSAPLTQHEAARPIIDSGTPSVLIPGSGFTLGGLQLHGIHVGTAQGDDRSSQCNHPLVRLTSQTDGRVYFCPTTEYSYRGIEPGRPSTCRVDVPQTVPVGGYSMHVISAGNASLPRNVYVSPSPAGAISINQYI